MAQTEPMVPVQGNKLLGLPAGQVPRSVARLAYEGYRAAFGEHSGGFDRLMDRGGFSWSELVAGIRGREAMCGLTYDHNPLRDIIEADRKEGGGDAVV